MITFQDIKKASGTELKEMRKNPILSKEIDEALRLHAEEANAKAAEVGSEEEARQLARIKRQEEIDAAQAELKLNHDAEVLRRSKLTPEEREAEEQARLATKQEEERQTAKEQADIIREQARLSTLSSAEYKAEMAEKKRLEDEAAAEAEKAETDRVEAERKAAEEAAVAGEAKRAEEAEAEKKALEEKERIVAEEAAKQPRQKIIREYQVRDDDGNPIGRPTHLEADTWEEMSQKQEQAHVNAMKLAERMRKRAALKPEFKQPDAPIEILSEEQLVQLNKDLESKDDVTIARAKAALELNEVRKERLENRRQAEYNRGVSVSNAFIKAHPEFNTCQANADVLRNYILENKLEWTVDNLEIAYAATESQLAPRAGFNSPAVSAEPTPAPVEPKKEIKQEIAAANPSPTPAPVAAAPAVPAPAPTPVEATSAAANPPAPARKPPATGIEPGTLHGGRQTSSTSKPVGLTKQDIARMPSDVFRLRLKKDPNFRKQLNALGITTL